MVQVVEREALPAERGGASVQHVRVTSSVIELTVSTYGAAIHRVRMPDRDGHVDDVHLNLTEHAAEVDPARNPHLGATCGRYANRIGRARFPLDGREVLLTPNEGPNQLHGGPLAFSRRAWTLTEAVDDGDGGRVVCTLVSPDGDEGYPGRVDVTVEYHLAGPSLRIAYRATTDAPTVVSLTNHGYWNLDGGGSADGHTLAVAASSVLEIDDAKIPTGARLAVDGTGFDLRTPTRVGTARERAGGAIDHCLVLDEHAADAPVAVLAAPRAGRWMTVASELPGLQVYTGNGLHDPFPQYGSVSLEAQQLPDAPNHPDFGDVTLRPGAQLRAGIDLGFGTGAPPALG